MLADEFIAATGGVVTNDDYPPSLRGDLPEVCASALLFARARLRDVDRLTGLRTRLETVNSPFFTCRAKELREGEYVLVIPIGLVCRLYVLAHLLLGYWKSTKVYMPVWATGEWRLPPGLQPLFGKVRRDGDGPWWVGLEDLYTQVRSSEAQYDAVRLTALALSFVVGHEAAHVYRRHGKALEAFKLLGAVRDEAEETVYRRFAETDADLMGTHWALDLQRIGLKVSGDRAPELAYLRMSYAVTMLYALYDVHRKEISAYTAGAYCHPVIRRHVFTAASDQVAHAYPEESAGWAEAELEGWRECALALHGLNEDVLVGRFGKVPEDRSCSPVSALQYNVTDGPRWQWAYEREIVLYRAVRRLYWDTVDFTVADTPPAVDFAPVDDDVLRRVMASDDTALHTAISMLRRHSEAR